MRFTTYSRYSGSWMDALNLQALLDRLTDFLLRSGFDGEPQWDPFGQAYDDAGGPSLDSLKDALLRALIESGELTPRMLAELRGDGQGDEEARQKVAELLDGLVQRLVEQGYIRLTDAGTPENGTATDTAGPGRVDDAAAAARNVEFELTQKGADFLGYRALQHLLAAMGRSRFGSHETPHLATGVEAEAASRPFAFGDALNLDIPATLGRAMRRAGAAVPLELDYPDLMVHQAEYRSACATVLLLDTSHSMILYGEDRFSPAKKVALALVHLIRTRFPGDSLRVVTFGDRAAEVPLRQLAHVRVGPYHTNTAEGLRIARRILMARRTEMRQIIMITDGKPSAITLPDGQVYKNPVGLDPRVLRATFREVQACRKAGISINTFMLARDPALVQFVARVCELARGRAFFTSTYTLGEYVMRDFLRRRTRRLR